MRKLNIRELRCADQLQFLLEKMAKMESPERTEVYQYWMRRRLLTATDCAVFEEWVRRYDGET